MDNADKGLIIRVETAGDFDAVRKLNKKAFGGKNESMLVDSLRQSDDFIPGLSIVAEKDGKVVGHILFSKIIIIEQGKETPALALAPMAVLPAYQNQGIGSALVKYGLDECGKSGHKIVVLVGHPEYYPRFGFVKAGEKGLKLPFEAADEVFMVAELAPGALSGVSGTVEYPPEFSAVN